MYSYNKLPEIDTDDYYLKRKRKSKKMGDGPSGTVKSPTKVTKTSGVLEMSLSTIPEAQSTFYERAKQAEVHLAQKIPSSKSNISGTSFSSIHSVNTTSTPLQPTQDLLYPYLLELSLTLNKNHHINKLQLLNQSNNLNHLTLNHCI